MTKKTWLQGMAAAALLAAGSFAQACTLVAWLGGTSGDATAGGPAIAQVPLARYSGECAMRATDGYVQDNSPLDEAQMITRFYFLPDPASTGTATIYETYSDKTSPELGVDDEGSPVYRVVYDADTREIVVDARPANGEATGPIDVSTAAGWISVEVEWESGGTMFVWVNQDATSALTPTAQAAAGTAVINVSRLGPQDLTGSMSLTFDDVEIRRTTAVGRLLLGDADNNGEVNIFDVISTINEIVDGDLVPGPADVNEDGVINIFDAIEQLNIIVG